MCTKKLLIIGAGFLQVYVIKKAKELGYCVLAVDMDPEAPGRRYADKFGLVNIVDEEAVLAFARENHVDGVLTAATDYGVLSSARAADELGLPGISRGTALIIKNKYETRRLLYEAGADDTEPTVMISSPDEIETALGRVVFPVMVKPCDGSGSRGASRADSAEEFVPACMLAMEKSLSHRATVERFIEGEEYGAESFVYGGEVHVLAVMKKKMTLPPYYAELGHALPSGLDEKTEERIRRSVETAIRALGINFGSVNMDLLLTKSGGVHIVDIGARMGGNLIGSHIVPMGTGVDYMAAMIRAAVGDEPDFTPRAHGPVATRLLALKPGKVQKLPDIEAIERENGVIIEHHLHIGDTINEYHTNLDGMGYVVARGANREEAEKLAERVRTLVDEAIVRC